MGVERVKEYREVELDVDVDASTLAEFYSEIPGQAMTLRHSVSFNTETTTTGRRPVNFRLAGTVKGKLAKLRLTSGGVVRVFAAKVLARALGETSGWVWVDLPVEGTASVFSAAALPIEPTPDGFAGWSLPIPATPLEPGWVNVPVDEV